MGIVILKLVVEMFLKITVQLDTVSYNHFRKIILYCMLWLYTHRYVFIRIINILGFDFLY